MKKKYAADHSIINRTFRFMSAYTQVNVPLNANFVKNPSLQVEIGKSTKEDILRQGFMNVNRKVAIKVTIDTLS